MISAVYIRPKQDKTDTVSQKILKECAHIKNKNPWKI